jgi:hypothetical protein
LELALDVCPYPVSKVSIGLFVQDGCRLSFYCKPYLLKLQFPHELCDAEDEAHCRAVYDANKVSVIPLMGYFLPFIYLKAHICYLSTGKWDYDSSPSKKEARWDDECRAVMS